VVADCQNGSLVFPLDSGPGSRGCFSARKWVGPNLGGSALEAWGWDVVTNAERWSAEMKVVTGGQLHAFRSEHCPSYVKGPTGLNWSPLHRSWRIRKRQRGRRVISWVSPEMKLRGQKEGSSRGASCQNGHSDSAGRRTWLSGTAALDA